MPIDRAQAQRIALDLIAEIASEWKTTDASRCVKRGGYYLFEFVIEPTRYTRLVTGPLDLTRFADSTVLFNPFVEATEIVLEDIDKLAGTTMDAEMRDYIVRRDGKTEILQMLTMAPDIFKDAIWQTRIMAGTVRSSQVLNTFGRPDLARGIVNSALDSIRDRVKKRLPRISNTRNPKINQFTISTALKTFFPKFKETGELPSQRQFAKAIGVTAKAWRTFLTNHSFDTHEVTIKEWYEVMLAKESNPNSTGDFPLVT